VIEIEYKENLNEELGKIINTEFNNLSMKNDINCNYTPFSFVASESGKIVGVITGHSYYNEVHIRDLVVVEQHRNKHIGSKLMEKVEDYHKDKGLDTITLTTYNFQAPEFYKKCGYQIEFIRENQQNSKLTKYFFTKSF